MYTLLIFDASQHHLEISLTVAWYVQGCQTTAPHFDKNEQNDCRAAIDQSPSSQAVIKNKLNVEVVVVVVVARLMQ